VRSVGEAAIDPRRAGTSKILNKGKYGSTCFISNGTDVKAAQKNVNLLKNLLFLKLEYIGEFLHYFKKR
jgi:hypothetical protein